MTLWTAGERQGDLERATGQDQTPHLAAVGFTVPDAAASLHRAYDLGARSVYRRTHATEVELPAVAAPDGTHIFLSAQLAGDGGWVAEFEHGEAVTESLVTGVDQVNLAQPWQDFDEAIVFYGSVLGLSTTASTEVAGPRGLVRSQVMRTDDGVIRIPLNVAPPVPDAAGLPSTSPSAVATSPRSPGRPAIGVCAAPVPDNYYDGYGATNAPIRLAAQRRLSG